MMPRIGQGAGTLGLGAEVPGPIFEDGAVLAIDVGNTITTIGLFQKDADGSDDPVLRWEITTPEHLTADEALLVLAQLAGPEKVVGAILSCVIPTQVGVWERALTRASQTRPFVVGPGLKTGLKMRYRDPAEVGPDRIADAVAVRERYQLPAISVDFGTSMNIEVIGADGAFLGGLIAPGLALGAQALNRRTARLPLIEIEMPKEVIGRSTREAMLSGVVFGEVARIDGLIDRVFAALDSVATVVLTGDGAHEMASCLSHDATVDETLALRGLHQLYKLNAGRGPRRS